MFCFVVKFTVILNGHIFLVKNFTFMKTGISMLGVTRAGVVRTARSVKRDPTATTAAASTSPSSASAMTATTDPPVRTPSAERDAIQRT